MSPEDLSPATPGRWGPTPPPCPFGPSPTGVGWFVLTAIGCLHGRCPCPAVLGGVPGPVPSYRLLTHALLGGRWSSCSEWVTLSQVHLLGGNLTHTVIELSGTEVPATVTCTFMRCSCQSTDRTRSTTWQPRACGPGPRRCPSTPVSVQ